jgi:hypothetical protein
MSGNSFMIASFAIALFVGLFMLLFRVGDLQTRVNALEAKYDRMSEPIDKKAGAK